MHFHRRLGPSTAAWFYGNAMGLSSIADLPDTEASLFRTRYEASEIGVASCKIGKRGVHRGLPKLQDLRSSSLRGNTLLSIAEYTEYLPFSMESLFEW